MKTVLTIAGSDSSGGAGIQADIKTMTMNGVYAMSVITALTAQNTMGVRDIMEVPINFLKEQIDAVFEDIYPDAVKIGMLSSSKIIATVAQSLKKYKVKYLVVDPVMVATSGAKLMESETLQTLQKELLPLATVITPNIPEAEVLSGRKINNEEDMVNVAREIKKKYGCSVLLKGGHSEKEANDFLCYDNTEIWFRGERVDNSNSHGTGCTLSSAIAANLAKGYSLKDAVENAKKYVTGALGDMMNLGRGLGPLNHGFVLKNR